MRARRLVGAPTFTITQLDAEKVRLEDLLRAVDIHAKIYPHPALAGKTPKS
jgi:hypothetical protein